METQIQHLVGKAWRLYEGTPSDRRLLIAISGIPGSGKTSLAASVADHLNRLASTIADPPPSPVAIFVPMDGFHLTRAQLSAMPDPETAHFRRGAAFTFDASSFVQLVRRVREPLTPSTLEIHAPSFDHKIKDPVQDDITIPASVRIVLFEGNYLSLQKDEWAEISELVDERWFVQVENNVARERLARRHAEAGIVDSVEKGRDRADKLDLINGREINDHRGRIDEIVVSIEDDSWRPENQGIRAADVQ